MSDQLRAEHGNADPEWALVQLAIREHVNRDVSRYEKMWAYYRNPLELVRQAGAANGGRGWYRSAQEVGLPTRIVGTNEGQILGGERGRREVVIENDIGWRVGAMVDFMFGSPVRIESLARDEKTRDVIEEVLESVWESSGGISLMQDMATLGHVFGHVDLLLRVDEEQLVGARVNDISQWISIEPIDARRGVAVMSPSDYRRIDAYAVHVERDVVVKSTTRKGKTRRLSMLKPQNPRSHEAERNLERSTQRVTELFTPDGWARFEDGVRIGGDAWGLMPGVLPIVHIQNMSQPFSYSGIGEVEALVGLQDELNTRLSDRASRVTMQSFKMYLAKGIEGFGGSSVGPGVVWSTDNPDAEIHGIGGDAHSPSEDSHINEIREAMDKISGVPPVAGGVVKTKLGNLSSATALRITLMSLIAKTLRKRVGYGRGIEQISGMVLDALDGAGVLKTAVGDRGVRVVWGALPVVDEASVVAAGRAKIDLGVEPEVVLDELGFGDDDPGVV
ncbi:MAG: phage portal protein [Phycisphaerales bacterium]|nr:phage portal protein [Phycisphaerales bacterium]